MPNDHKSITETELKEMEGVTNAATDGPWAVGHDGPSRPMLLTADTTEGQRMLSISGYGAYKSFRWGSYENEEADHAFAAMARNEMPRLIAEVRCLREALEHYGSVALWWYPTCGGVGSKKTHFEPLRADLRGEPGYKLARQALGWQYPPPEPCPNPKCDGIDEEDGTPHRCFKDGHYLDDGSAM